MTKDQKAIRRATARYKTGIRNTFKVHGLDWTIFYSQHTKKTCVLHVKNAYPWIEEIQELEWECVERAINEVLVCMTLHG